MLSRVELLVERAGVFSPTLVVHGASEKVFVFHRKKTAAGDSIVEVELRSKASGRRGGALSDGMNATGIDIEIHNAVDLATHAVEAGAVTLIVLPPFKDALVLSQLSTLILRWHG